MGDRRTGKRPGAAGKLLIAEPLRFVDQTPGVETERGQPKRYVHGKRAISRHIKSTRDLERRQEREEQDLNR
jgi:hypothetical protein